MFKPYLSVPRTAIEIDLPGSHHSVVVFVITPEGKIMADRKLVDSLEHRDHFKWVLPMIANNGPYRTVEQVYQSADKALGDTFGFEVGMGRVNFAGSYEERAGDGSVAVAFMSEVKLADVGAVSTPSTNSSEHQCQFTRMTKEARSAGYPFSSPPNCYTRYDLLHWDRLMWNSDVRHVLIQYFALCDQLSKDMMNRRTSLLPEASGSNPTLITFGGTTLEGKRTVTRYEQVPLICRSDLGLSTAQYYSS